MRFAYADPPYPGMAKMYKDHPDYDGEVDHRKLIETLEEDFPDGWALSTAMTTLRIVLPLCPDDVRVLAWVKPWTFFKPNVRLAYCWEPVLLKKGRYRGREYDHTRDWFACSVPLGEKFLGFKPEPMMMWLFNCLGALPGDDLVDLFPGSGAVGRAWDRFQRQAPLPTTPAEIATQATLVEVQS